jgi:hypothetical protein
MTSKTKEPDKKALREFGLVTGAIVIGLFGLLFPWLLGRTLPYWPWIVGAILSGWALVLPGSLSPVYRGWMALGHALGWVNTRIILAVVFYLVFLPAGLVMKLLGKDPLHRALDKSSTTYRVPQAQPKKDHVERPY